MRVRYYKIYFLRHRGNSVIPLEKANGIRGKLLFILTVMLRTQKGQVKKEKLKNFQYQT